MRESSEVIVPEHMEGDVRWAVIERGSRLLEMIGNSVLASTVDWPEEISGEGADILLQACALGMIMSGVRADRVAGREIQSPNSTLSPSGIEIYIDNKRWVGRDDIFNGNAAGLIAATPLMGIAADLTLPDVREGVLRFRPLGELQNRTIIAELHSPETGILAA